MKKLCIVGLILISLLYLYAHSEDFVIGNYSYLTPTYESFYQNMAQKMSQANFNATIWTPSNSDNNTNLIESLDNYSIDSFLYDHITIYDDGNISEISLRNLSMGNFYQFDVEYDSLSSLNNSDDRYFYKFNITRPGERYGFNDYTWKCTPDPNNPAGGVIIDQLMYRWYNFYPGNDGYHPIDESLRSIGQEFQFAYQNNFNDDNYLEGNKLYVSFIYKIDDDVDNRDCMKFGLKLYGQELGDLEESWHFINLRNTESPTEENSMFTYTAAELLDDDYSTPLNPDYPYQFRKVTFYLELEDLNVGNNKFLEIENINRDGFINAHHNNVRLKGIMPYVYWEGNHLVELDYIEIEDDIHKLLDNENISSTISLVNQRIDQFTCDVGVTKFYTQDEPMFPQFDSYKKLEQYFADSPNVDLLTTINASNYDLKKDNGERYSHLNLFNGTTPREIMVDYYPLKHNSEWNNENAPSNKFIQFHIDWYVSANYRRAKKIASERPLYAVPCTAGLWNVSGQKWHGYQYPTINMIKCLQYLPLCYGVDGVIDYKLYSRDTSDTLRWYALLDSDSSEPVPPQYEAIKQANAKLAVYGPILKDLEWIDATTISTNGIEDLHTGINANIYNFSDEALFSSTSDPYFSASDISIDPNNDNNDDLYNGYVHIGFFKDTDNYPTYMLVNRRTDYVNGNATNMQYITPETMMSEYNEQNAFREASSQLVEFVLDQNIVDEFGEYVALFDPASKHSYYKNESAEICVEIDPGEGIMLELASTLPDIITENITLKGKVLIDATNTIVIPQNIIIETDESSKVYVNQNIQIMAGAKLILRGDVEINNTITVKEGGELKIERANASLNLSNSIFLDGGELKIERANASLNFSNSIVLDGGTCIFDESIIASEASLTISTPQNWNHIRNLNVINSNVSNTFFFLSNTNIDIVDTCFNGSSKIQSKYNEDTLSININSTMSNNISKGFFNTNVTGIGTVLKIEGDCNVSINNITFSGYLYGVSIENNQSSSDINITNNRFINIGHSITYNRSCEINSEYINSNSFINCIEAIHYEPQSIIHSSEISDNNFNYCECAIKYDGNSHVETQSINNCTFSNCEYGIYSATQDFNAAIINCNFKNRNTLIEGVGLHFTAGIPLIRDCSFESLEKGIFSELSTFSGPRQHGINDCDFRFCKFAVIARDSNIPVRNSIFYRNSFGLTCFEKANMNLSNNANNVLKNKDVNINFPTNEGNRYASNIQLLGGHNDFYHESNGNGGLANDFYFDSDLAFDPQNIVIDASKNWFINNEVLATHSDPTIDVSSWVLVESFDSEPNVEILQSDERFYTALNAEQTSEYSVASSIYRAILDEALMTEEALRSSSIDGVFRCDFLVNQNFNEALSYFEEKKVQYTLIDESFVKLIDTYIIKVKLIKKEYQDVIAILEERINNPTSAIDSLGAVLDLEIVLKLAEDYLGKAQVNTSLAKYRYKDLVEYEAQHKKHWDMLMALSNLPKTDNFVEMIPDLVDIMNYPNPFNPETTIRFGIPKSGNTEVKIYNIKGQLVKTLFKGYKEAGYHSVVWNGRNRNNQSVASGIYFTRVTSEGKSKVTKLILMK